MHKTNIVVLTALGLSMLAIQPAAAQTATTSGSFGPTGTTTVSLNVAAEAAIRIDTPTTSLATSGLGFTSDYTGTTNFTYKIRTSKTGGTGAVTMRVTSDFPAGGPSVASPAAGDSLMYTCKIAQPGSGCGNPQASTTKDTDVATFGADARSLTKAGTGGNSLNWVLTNDPAYSTGSYAATVTLTISAM